jgi:hypothetical protein
MNHDKGMKTGWSLLIAIVTFALLGTEGEAGRLLRDFSGDAMQIHHSRMPESPMNRIPTLLGSSFWPYLNYPPAPSLTIVNVQIQIPALDQPPSPPPAPPAPPKFWTARCGIFVELSVNSTMNLMEEERKPCAQ